MRPAALSVWRAGHTPGLRAPVPAGIRKALRNGFSSPVYIVRTVRDRAGSPRARGTGQTPSRAPTRGQVGVCSRRVWWAPVAGPGFGFAKGLVILSPRGPSWGSACGQVPGRPRGSIRKPAAGVLRDPRLAEHVQGPWVGPPVRQAGRSLGRLLYVPLGCFPRGVRVLEKGTRLLGGFPGTAWLARRAWRPPYGPPGLRRPCGL